MSINLRGRIARLEIQQGPPPAIDWIWLSAELEPQGYHKEAGDFHYWPVGKTIDEVLAGQRANPKIYIAFDPREV